jgi:type IV pilus assembly protein PilQ
MPVAADTTEEPAPAEEAALIAPPEAVVVEETSSAEPAPSTTPQAPGLISVDFKDADIRQVLRIISLKSGVDIVAGPDVEGLVTIKLTNVPWEQALDVILRTYGLSYDRKDNIVRVMTAAAIELESLGTEVYPLSYAKAKDVGDLVKEMLTDRGKVKFDERTNTVIVIDLPSNLFQLGQVVKRLDQITPQVRIESKIIETNLSTDDHLGINWSDSLTMTASGTSAPTTFPFPGGGNLGDIVGSTFIPRTAGGNEARIPEVGGTFTFGTISATALAITLNAISNRTDTNIMSNPSITTMNNKEAFVQVGEDINIPNFQIDPSTGRATVSGFQTRSTGVLLKVTPHVNQEKEIVLDLKPEITETAATFDTFASGISFPRFTVQKADTQVRLDNGETLVIGGLVKRKKTVAHAKVPFLGDIPILGHLFSDHDVATPTHQDLLIFITVNLVEDALKADKALAAQPSE